MSNFNQRKQPLLLYWMLKKLTPVDIVAKFAQLAKPKSWVHKILGQ